MANNTLETADPQAANRIIVRMLIDWQTNVGETVKSGCAIELDADIANDLIDNGLADGNADAVAYALANEH